MTKGSIRKEGDQTYGVTSDDESRDVLERILTELKILNMHMAYINDETITEGDI